jgi:hypothetical protein
VGVSVPRLALTAEGALALELVAVPVGEGVAVLGASAAAVAVLSHTSASSGAAALPVGGPGQWEYKKEGMKPPARKYQAQISGAPEDYCYTIGKVRFDGYKNGVLLEAKGPGYAKQIGNAVENNGWYEGFGEMVKQAERQIQAAKGTPIEWHFAEKEAADFVRELFQKAGFEEIRVIHTPPAF